jgi:hypothetical protein
VTIGNAKQVFSREQLTSSKKQQLVERTFVGDHNYGSPDRSLGVHVTGHNSDKMFEWAATASAADIDPSSSKVDFDTPVNANSDFNQGWLFAGRVDYHPFGHLKKEQGDFKRETKATIGAAAFTWNNDKDNTASANSLDSVTGFEISGAFRGAGASVDVQYNSIEADAIDTTLSTALFSAGSTTLEQYSIEGGYMVVPSTLEIVAGYQAQDADGYTDTWTRTSIGANWFLEKHDIKLQFTYRIGEAIDGVSGADEDEGFLQAQYVF